MLFPAWIHTQFLQHTAVRAEQRCIWPCFAPTGQVPHTLHPVALPSDDQTVITWNALSGQQSLDTEKCTLDAARAHESGQQRRLEPE